MSLFVASRSALRAAAPLKRVQLQARRYATESSEPKKNNTALYGALGLTVAGAGYYFLSGTPSAAKKAEEKVAEKMSAEPKKAFTGGEQSWLSLTLQEVETLNHNTKRFRFKLPEDDMVSGLHVASALLTKFKPEGADKPVIRPYTPISDEDARGYMDLLVKKYPNGPMSTHLHELKPGQTLDIKGPIPKYPWSPNKHEHIALIAGGTGITPMYQLIHAVLKNPEDKTKITLVFGNVTEEDILLRKELEALENTHPRQFRTFYVLDRAPKGWNGHQGYITKELLKTVLPEPKEGPEKIKVFVCGPPGMMEHISGNKKSPKDQGELKGILKELGYTPEQVFKF